jgi:prepilin-type N-terminal cleavage/methylation domain-containing protein
MSRAQPPHRFFPACRGRHGFTLIELAVAITLASVIVAGLYQLFIAQSRQLQFLDLQAEMNQNLRFATDILTRTIRHAGLGTATGTAGPLGNGGSAGDVLNPVLGYDDPLGMGPDAITVVHQDPSLTLFTSTMFTYPGDTTELAFNLGEYRHTAKLGQYVAGEYLLCSDFANPMGMASYLWVISSVDLSSSDYGYIHLDSNGGYTDYTTVMPSTRNLPSVMSCSKGEIVTFYIDDVADGVGPGSEQHPVLMMDLDFDWPADDDVPLVDDIEDIQFQYCLEDSGGAPCTADSSWISTLSTSEWPWMVRVSVLARSRQDEATGHFEGVRPGLANHSPAVTTDHYYRQFIQTDVTLRNMRFYSNVFSE